MSHLTENDLTPKPDELRVHPPEIIRSAAEQMTTIEKAEILRQAEHAAGMALYTAFHTLGCSAHITSTIEVGDERFTLIFCKTLPNYK